MRRPGIALVLLAALIALLAIACKAEGPPPYFEVLWNKRTGFIAANDPLAIDLDNDGANEIVLSDSRGHLTVFQGRTGKVLWSQVIKEVSFTGPAVGHFWGDGSLDVAVADNKGFVHLFNGSDGRLLRQVKVEKAVGLDPTVVPPDPKPDPQGNVAFDPALKDRLIVIDDTPRLYCLAFDPDAKQAEAQSWATDQPIAGQPKAPASVGDVDGDGRFDIVLGVARSRLGALYIFRASDGSLLPGTPAEYPAQIATIPALADVDGVAGDEIFFGTMDPNHLYAVRYEKTAQKLWTMLWPVIRQPTGDPLLLAGPTGRQWKVFIRSSNLIHMRPLDGSAGIDQMAQAEITSRLALVAGISGARPRLIFGDELGDVYDWWAEALEEKSAVQYPDERLGETPIVADFDGQPGAECLFLFPQQRRMRMVRLPDFPAPAGSIVWQTRAGNLWRTGWRDERYHETYLKARYAHLQNLVAANLDVAQKASEAGQWRKALDATAAILDISPKDAAARKMYLRAWVRSRLFFLATSGLIGLAALGFLSYALLLLGLRTVGLRRADELVKAGRLAEATDLLARLHRRFPSHSRTHSLLANLLIQQSCFDPQYLSALERAFADHPGDSGLLHALSECYVRAGSLLPKAREIYLKSLDISERPAELKFLIGRSFLAEHKLQEAVRYLSESIAQGFQNEQAYQSLADAYEELHVRESAVIPVLERVFPQRMGNRPFLIYLCEVYRANGRTDPMALQCAQRTLELEPTCASAQFLYAEILLEQGNAEQAWQRARTMYGDNPDDPQILRLAARCLIALDRRDDEAIQILEKALGHHPDDGAMLAHLSHVFFMRGWFDPHAAGLYRRAYEKRPEDDRVVEAMADLAERAGDSQAAARHLETLLQLGRESREILLRLACAYRDLAVTSDLARKALEAAVQEKPDDLDYLGALGKVYIALGDTSRSAATVLGRLHAAGVTLPGLERQLIIALDRNNEHARLIDLCDKYLAAHPEDTDVKRIRGHAYLATGQVTHAVAEYEQLLERGAEDDKIVADVAAAYAHTGRSDERAIALYTRALRLSPDDALLRRALGRAHAERGDLQEAIAQFRTALRLHKDCAPDVVEQCQALLAADPNRAPLRWFLAELLINCGRFREAIDHLQYLYDHDPDSPDRIFEALKHIIEVDGQNLHARRVRGSLLLRSGRLAEARTDLEDADRFQPDQEETLAPLRQVYEELAVKSDDAEVRLRLGRIYHRAGDLDNALRCFQKAVRDYRFETEATREMGKVFMEKGLLDLALEEFQKLRVDDDLKETLYQLGQLYEQRGDGGGARAAYRLIFAADAGFRDVQQRYETLAGEPAARSASLDRSMILSQLGDKAKHRYKLLEEIGRGAMGIVYRAMDSELDEIVALKILPDNLTSNSEALARFRREARSARRLSHRNIVRIHDIGEEMGRKYISMEIVEGTTLKALIRATGGVEIPRAIKFACQILDALAYAHSMGIVHRDIKPANIIISHDDEVKITDFGIAKILASAESTAEGAVVGTPLYMSPEQVRGESVDHRADIYSVGILLYECVEGKPPFVKGDLAYSHLHVWPEPMERGIPALNQAILRALEKRKEDRWPTARAMLDALQSLALPKN